MNKYIIFALLFVFVLNADFEEEYKDFMYDKFDEVVNCTYAGGSNPSVDKCSAIKFSNEDYNCCYVTIEAGGKKIQNTCWGVKKSDVKDYVNDVNDEADDDDGEMSIDCSSNYISNALLILLSLLF
jgi:hypothetical protein